MNARVVVALFALALPARSQFVQPEGSRFHNGSSLLQQDDGRAAPLLQKLQAAMDRKDAEETISLLGALRALPGPELVALGPRLHVPALERAARWLGEPGREPLAAAVAESERAALAAARADRDLAALLDRASRGVSLPTAREAALLAARLQFEEGRFREALGLATRAACLPGADALAAAARQRLPAEPPPPELGTALQPQQAVALTLPDVGSDGKPFVASAAPGKLLLLDGNAVFIIDRASRALAAPPLRPLDVFANAAELLTNSPAPAPTRFAAARSGERWVFPYDPITQLGWALDYASMPRTAFLVAADGGSSPRRAWTAQPAPGDEDSTAFGPCAVAGGRVYVQLFRTAATTAVSLCCFDLGDGRLLWDTPLASAATVAPFEVRFPTATETPRAVEIAPAERDGVVWCCTGFGVVAALDALSGSPLFLFRYDRLYPQDIGNFDPAFLWETGGWDDEPLRFWNGRVLVAPPDSRFLYMLASEPGPRGQLVLDDPIERLDRRHVVALEPDPQGRPSPALLCTRRGGAGDGLVRLGPDGHVLELGARLPPRTRLTGRPLRVGDRVFAPSTGGLLELSATDLQAPPRPVASGPGVPLGVEEVFALDAGVATLSPPTPTSKDVRWVVQWLAPSP